MHSNIIIYDNDSFKGFGRGSPSNPHSSPALLIQHPSAAAVILPPAGPQPVWLNLRPPAMLWIFAKKMLRKRPRPEIISTGEIRAMLKLNKGNKLSLYKLIHNAMDWDMLMPAKTKKGKAMRGYYDVNWDAVNYVASLIPLDTISGKALNITNGRPIRNYGELRPQGVLGELLDTLQEFRVMLGRGNAPVFCENENEEVNNTCNTDNTAFTQLRLRHLRLTHISLGPIDLPALILGGGRVYFIPIGIGGGAKSRFPCLVYPNGKYVCAGSLKALQKLIASTNSNPPEPMPYGGSVVKPVVDIPAKGVEDYDKAPDSAPRLEVGVQIYGSALQSCFSRWHILITTDHKLPQELKGWPSLILLPLKNTAKSISYDPDALSSDVLFCIDALIGTRHTIMNGLGKLKGTMMPQALAIAKSITPPEAIDSPVDIYIEYKPKVKVKGSNRWRHDRGSRLVPLDKFILELKSRDSVEVAEFLKIIVPLPEISNLKELLTLGYIYGYHNDNKDPPNAIRLELRPYKDITKRFEKRGLMTVLLGTLALIGQPLIEAWRVLARLARHGRG